jgi:hypothetical protein
MPRFNIIQPSLVREAGRSSRPFNQSTPTELISLSNSEAEAEEFVEDEELENNLLGDEELLADSHLTPKTEPFPTSAADTTQDLLLDESSLATVLEILTTIATVEELTILEALTTAQKRQVWSHTPETIKLKLKQIRQTAVASPATDVRALQGWHTLEHSDCNQPLLKVGDAVVLLANPKLTSAELIAIWEVVEVHEASARLQSHLGTRNYPISWMVHYPKPISTSA